MVTLGFRHIFLNLSKYEEIPKSPHPQNDTLGRPILAHTVQSVPELVCKSIKIIILVKIHRFDRFGLSREMIILSPSPGRELLPPDGISRQGGSASRWCRDDDIPRKPWIPILQNRIMCRLIIASRGPRKEIINLVRYENHPKPSF